jgi:hypothetical protein
MLGLKLRDEFLGTHMPGTAISLRTSDNQGAAQKSPEYILSITYPTADVQTALKAISSKRSGRPIVLMGDRGRGKSHIMAVMHHAVASPETVEKWLRKWGGELDSEELITFETVKGFVAISEPVHNHEYPLLWNLLFDRHPKGDYYRGQFEQMAQPFPPRSLLEKMFADQPTCLILDEFQNWFAGLSDKDPKTGLPLKQWAYNFIQNLSEIAKDRPEILILSISVLNNQNDAFQQVHRQGPVVIDFIGPSAKQDRQRLLLHRLFDNRRNIPDSDIVPIAGAYGSERFRLLHVSKSDAEKDRILQQVIECWPFSPELLDLLEDQILLSQAAQETRDMIRILAHIYRSRGNDAPVITPADFFVDGATDEVQTLIDSIAVIGEQDKLRQIAQRNLQSLRDSGVNVPNARELISSIWMRSMSPGRIKGGTPSELHLDITRTQAVDDNAFQAEITQLIENSVNIHGDQVPGGPLWFGLNENPRSKVRAFAKNNKLWQIGVPAVAGQTIYPRKDNERIRKTVRHILEGPETRQTSSKIIVLGPNWNNDPWSDVDEVDKPSSWDRPVLLVIPEQIEGGNAGICACLGNWLVKHLQKRRNTVRFLLPASDASGLYTDNDLIYSARCSFLCSSEGWGSDTVYRALLQDFDRPLRNDLKARFNRFAILQKWDFQQPQNCVFEIEKLSKQGADIPGEIEEKIISNLFDRTDFRTFVLKRAKDSDFVGSLMDDLIEPPPPGTGDAMPFLGETKIYDFILDSAAKGDLVLNVGGTWIGRRPEDTSEEDSKRYIKTKAFRTGQEMRQVQLGLPGIVGGSTVTAPGPGAASVTPTVPPTGTSGNVTPQPEITNPGGGTGIVADRPIPGGDSSGGGTTKPPVSAPVVQQKRSGEPANGINLSGCFESWGIAPTKTLDTIKIEFSGLNTQQVKQILQRIPSAFKATLEVSFKEGDDQ